VVSGHLYAEYVLPLEKKPPAATEQEAGHATRFLLTPERGEKFCLSHESNHDFLVTYSIA
jgi:hypothetical protein